MGRLTVPKVRAGSQQPGSHLPTGFRLFGTRVVMRSSLLHSANSSITLAPMSKDAKRKTRGGMRAIPTALWVSLFAVIAASMIAFGASAAGAATKTVTATDEFQAPSWTSLPARSVYNRLPSCKLDKADGYMCYPAISGSAQAADPDNPEYYVNSAYWPAEQRPDIEHYAMNRYGYFYDHNCQDNTVHYCFYLDAKKLGYPTSHTPKVGDLAVFPGGCATSGQTAPVDPNCLKDDPHDWYVEYVQHVYKNGAYIGSGGGAADNNNVNNIDSGIIEQVVSKNSDKYTHFIGLMPKKKKLKAPKHRKAEPSEQVRFAAYPTTDDPSLKVRFWLTKKAATVKLKLSVYSEAGQTSSPGTVTLTNQSAGAHTVELALTPAEDALFGTQPYNAMSYTITVDGVFYSAPVVTAASSSSSAADPAQFTFGRR
jgi:hypothetical protein